MLNQLNSEVENYDYYPIINMNLKQLNRLISWDILGSSEVVVVGFSDSYVFRIFFKVSSKFCVSGVVRIACPKKSCALHDFGLFPPCFHDSRVV